MELLEQRTPYENDIAMTVVSKGNSKMFTPKNENLEMDGKTDQKKLFECTMMTNPIFLSLCVAIVFLALSFNSVLIFIPPLAASLGLSSIQGAIVLSVAGVFDTFSRMLSGAILDMKKIKPFRMVAYNCALFFLSILTFFLAFVSKFWQLVLIAALYGLLIGTYSSQKSVILADLLGTNTLSSSFAILICFQGVGTLIGPPFIGRSF